MATREQGLRRTATVTVGIAAAGILGSVGVGVLAYAQDHSSVTGTSQGGTSSAQPSVTTVPETTGAHANSGGS